MTLADLQRALRAVEPAAVLVSPRMLENIIRQTDRFSGLVWQVPHRESCIIDRQTLFRHVDQEELALGPDQLLPQTVILLAWPESEELEAADSRAVLRKYWQRLFHASVHLTFDNLLAEGKLTPSAVRERLEELGPSRFEEIRTVLVQDHYLGQDADERSVYVEFAAVFLELASFAPDLLPAFFPILRDIDEITRLLNRDVPSDEIYQRTRLSGAIAATPPTTRGSEEAHEYYWKLVRSSDKAAQQGNVVRAAIQRQRAARVAPAARAYTTRQAAVTQLLGLVDRLEAALDLSPAEVEEWRKHLPALLDKADQGSHPVEAALLYDLQKVCLDHEREIYALDLVEWILSGGKRPIQRPLPSQRLVRVTRTLRSATPRLAMARLSDDDRNQFASLLQEAVQRSEDQIRHRFRPLLTDALHDVGLNPGNPLEATAFRKVIEELLDRIIASGFVTFSDLRDTLSRSALKLPDLTDPQDFIRGDPLLRLDRRLGTLLDGVYRSSEIYLRWLERFTALNFGTPLGRLLTAYVTVPFLGAFLILEMFTKGLQYLGFGEVPNEVYYPIGVVLGLFMVGLLHSAPIRERCVQMGKTIARPLRAFFVDGPLWLLRHTSLKEVMATWSFQLCYWYIFKPLVLGALVLVFVPEEYKTFFVASLVFLASMFFINSRPGQAVGEAVSQALLGLLTLLRAGLIPGLVTLVADLFKQILHLGETLLFTVDEWLRFRGGDSRPAMIARAMLSLIWFPIAYLIRFNVVVLIEPTLNPLKFPIVTVATKIMAPMLGIMLKWLLEQLNPLVGTVLATALAWWITFWLPDAVAFIIWEMKENWSLYHANRRPAMGPVTLGGRSETLRGLLQPGFHSGTIPRLFARLRQAERNARGSGSFSGVRACQSALEEVKEAVHLFVTREFCELLGQTPAWKGPVPTAGPVALATNQIHVELGHADFPDSPMCLEFENRGGSLLAGISVPGWLVRLPRAQQILLHNALTVLYTLAGIDLVRERAIVEPAAIAGPGALEVVPRAFRAMPITWEQCVACWQNVHATSAPLRLIEDGYDLVPSPTHALTTVNGSASLIKN